MRRPQQTLHLARLVTDIRRLFQQLKTLADELHADLGVNASQRAVLEALEAEGPASVATLARRKRVSRQHIQVLVDALVGRDLVALQPNPAHQRSPLVALSDDGAAIFNALRQREAPILARLAASIDGDALATTMATLGSLSLLLSAEIGQLRAASSTKLEKETL